MNFKVGDEVVVIAGSDKGKTGKIVKTLRAENKVVVEGVKIVKKHQKPTGQDNGGIIEKEAQKIHTNEEKQVIEKKIATDTN